jgi:cellulose synthase/poly-beta-1,6-N-acetylglucosamine synthase-like glycosyltransferase
MRHFYLTFLSPVNTLVLIYFVGLGVFYVTLFFFATLEVRLYLHQVKAERYREILSSELTPSISILVPAHNEGPTIVESLRALLTVSYPQLELIVVDDGSDDDTIEVMQSTFGLVPIQSNYDQRIETARVKSIYRSSLFPNLTVASKENGGKADSLNAALNLATSELVCAIDADTILDPEGLRRLVRPFIKSRDVIAAGATIRVVNGCSVNNGRIADERGPHRFLAGIQAVEYLRAFLFGRPAWNRLGGNLLISGAFGLFRRENLLDAQGYMKTVGEDMELVVRLRRRAYESGTPGRVEFVPDPVAWTEAPTAFRQLGNQRERWHRGFTDVLWRHRDMIGRKRFGMLGMVVIPAFIVFEWLAPIVEAIGLVLVPIGLIFGMVSGLFAVLFFSLACGVGVLLSMASLVLEELSFRRYGRLRDRVLLVAWALLENLGYRQLTVFWRLSGIVHYIRGKRSWGSMNRKGFQTDGDAEIVPIASGPVLDVVAAHS